MNIFNSAMSIAATWIWAPALFVSAERAYINGWIGLFWFLVPNILCLIIFIPFVKIIRNKIPDGITLSGYMKSVYKSDKVKNIYLFQLGVLSILSTAVQLLAGGKILSTITGISFFKLTVILSIIAFSYSQFSGIKVSVITDSVQMIIMIMVCVFIPWALHMNNGVYNMIKGMSGITGEYKGLFDIKGIEIFLSFGLPTAIGLISGPFGDQCFWQRAFSIKEDKIGKAFFIGALLFAVVPLSMGILGFISAGSGYIALDSGVVNFELVFHIFPKWCMVLFLFMIISGLLSTIDSNLCAVSSLMTDIFDNDKNLIRISKYTMVGLLIISIIIANIKGLTVTHLFLIYGTLRASTLLPTIMTLKDKRLSSNGVFCGILLSLIVGLPIFAYGTLLNISLYKTIGSLITVFMSGITALIIKGDEENKISIRKKTKHKQ